MFKKIFFVIAVTVFSFGHSQQIGANWEIGIGGDIVRFSDKDAPYIGDKHIIQVPRFNVTRRINDSFSLDGAVSFGAFDSLIITNQVPYISIDGSVRYRYVKTLEKLQPYIFIGAGIVESHPKRRTTPTFNGGTGLTYWISDSIGLNTQVYYKYSLESFESMRSHIQASVSIIFGINSGARRGRRGGGSCYYNQYR